MAAALIALEVLIGLSCIFLMVNQLTALPIAGIWIGATLLIVASRFQPGEALQARNSARAVWPFFLVPLAVMVVQCLPNPVFPNSIWSTAALALNERVPGLVTIDFGATILSLCQYMVLIGVVIGALCIATDRRRAESLLFVTAGSAVLLLLVSLVTLYAGLHSSVTGVYAVLQTGGSLGILIFAALISRSIEKSELSRGPNSWLRDFVIALVGLAICTIVIIPMASMARWMAVICGLIPVALLPVARRFFHKKLEIRLVMAFSVLLVLGTLGVELFQRSGDVSLKLAATADASQVGIAQRMLGDIGWFGSGAGTYPSLVPLYRALDDPAQIAFPPTTAAVWAITMGRNALGLFVVMGFGFGWLLVERAAKRGRDSFYPALGGGCVLLIALDIFLNSGFLAMPVLIISSAIVGLALGQSLSARPNA